MSYNNGQLFSTIDRDQDEYSDHCVRLYGEGAWWYKGCTWVNLNGQRDQSSTNGMYWYGWKIGEQFKKTSMKFRPTDF